MRHGHPIDTGVTTFVGEQQVRKELHVPADYQIEHLNQFVQRLRQCGVIPYTIEAWEIVTGYIGTVREKVEGTPVLDCSGLAALEDRWATYVDNYLTACDAFHLYGYGFIPTEVSELHNVLLTPDQQFVIIDIETSFLVCHDRAQFDRYIGMVYLLMTTELRRVALLEQIESSS